MRCAVVYKMAALDTLRFPSVRENDLHVIVT